MQEANSTNSSSDTSDDQKPKAQKFFWLASDGWGKQKQVVKDIEDYAVGAITVELESKKIAGNLSYLIQQLYYYSPHGNISTSIIN